LDANGLRSIEFAHEINFVELFSNKIHALITAMPCLSLNQKEQIDQLLSTYKDYLVTSPFKGSPATVHLKLVASPVFVRA